MGNHKIVIFVKQTEQVNAFIQKHNLSIRNRILAGIEVLLNESQIQEVLQNETLFSQIYGGKDNLRLHFYKKGTCYYKIHLQLNKITCIDESNWSVSYLDYSLKGEIEKFTKIKDEIYRNVEHRFWHSREFEWEHNGKKYRTCKLKWKQAKELENRIVWYNGRLYQFDWFIDDSFERVMITSIFNNKDTRRTDIKWLKDIEEIK